MFFDSNWMLPASIALVFSIWDTIIASSDEQTQGRIIDDKKPHEEFIKDIRQANTYCSYYFAFITILAGLLLKNGSLPTGVTKHDLVPFTVAIVAASISLLFIPANYRSMGFLKFLWWRSVVCQKIVVIFTLFGLFRIALNIVNSGSP